MRSLQLSGLPRVTAALALSGVLAACGSSDRAQTDSAGGSVGAAATVVDTTGASNANVPAAGGSVQVTPNDGRSVSRASEYKLTDANFRQFMAATESLAVLRTRDPQVRAMFTAQGGAGGATAEPEVNAGRKQLEENPAVNAAITSTGMSAKDYFIAAIAVAQAQRFMGNPEAAPPTPALPGNAEFLRGRAGEVARLKAIERANAAQ